MRTISAAWLAVSVLHATAWAGKLEELGSVEFKGDILHRKNVSAIGVVGNLLGEVPTPADAKAEGVTILKETDSDYEILVVYDGAKDGGATRFRATKP
jgi:hypothetical protein